MHGACTRDGGAILLPKGRQEERGEKGGGGEEEEGAATLGEDPQKLPGGRVAKGHFPSVVPPLHEWELTMQTDSGSALQSLTCSAHIR